MNASDFSRSSINCGIIFNECVRNCGKSLGLAIVFGNKHSLHSKDLYLKGSMKICLGLGKQRNFCTPSTDVITRWIVDRLKDGDRVVDTLHGNSMLHPSNTRQRRQAFDMLLIYANFLLCIVVACNPAYLRLDLLLS